MDTLQKQYLFWDVDRGNLDPKRHRKFIIERILARGDVDDVRFAKKEYGEDAIKETLLQSRSLDAKSLFFWCLYFNINAQQCIKKPSLLKRAAFWKK